MEKMLGEYRISNDRALFTGESIKELLSKSYWASSRPITVIEKSLKNSDCYGAFLENKLVGFARVVTDFATVFWLCDVIIHEEHRGKGIGKALVKIIVEAEDYKDLRGILATKDAHGLYEQYGFEKAIDGRFMMKPLP